MLDELLAYVLWFLLYIILVQKALLIYKVLHRFASFLLGK